MSFPTHEAKDPSPVPSWWEAPVLSAPVPTRRDVSSVELLMNDHQGLKSEIEARAKSIAACLELGKTLILSKSPAADEVPPRVDNRRVGVGTHNTWGVPTHLLHPRRSKPTWISCWRRRRR